MAAVIVAAALLDVVWWVPAQRRASEDASARTPVELNSPRCRKARLEAERAKVQQEIDALERRADQLDLQIDALEPHAR